MIYLLAVLGILFVVYSRTLVEKWSSYRHRKRLSAAIPGDEGLPVVGHLFEIGDAEAITRMFLDRSKAAKDGWDAQLGKLWLVHESAFVPFTGEMLQSKEEINKGRGYDFFVQWLGRGLLLAGGDRWRAKRKMLTPSFHFTMLLGYIDTMNSHVKILVDVMGSQTGKEFDVYPFLKRFTLDVICGEI